MAKKIKPSYFENLGLNINSLAKQQPLSPDPLDKISFSYPDTQAWKDMLAKSPFVFPIDPTQHRIQSSPVSYPEPETKKFAYWERPYAPLKEGNITFIGATMLDHYTSVALEGLMSNPEYKDTPISDLVQKAIQTAHETCRQLETIENLKHGY